MIFISTIMVLSAIFVVAALKNRNEELKEAIVGQEIKVFFSSFLFYLFNMFLLAMDDYKSIFALVTESHEKTGFFSVLPIIYLWQFYNLVALIRLIFMKLKVGYILK